jgi:hypothetical protein
VFDGTPPLASFNRICVLDESNPGYVRRVNSSQNELYKVFCGYVVAFEIAEPDETFIGVLSQDTMIFSFLINFGA